jgi:hypothetical protein
MKSHRISGMIPGLVFVVLLGMAHAMAFAAADIEASTASARQLTLYDQGFGMMSEVRSLKPARGINQIRFSDLPAGVEPSSISFVPVAGVTRLQVLEQQFLHDAPQLPDLLRRFLQEEITVVARGERVVGRLWQVPDWIAGQPLILSGAGQQARVFAEPDAIQEIILPDAARRAYLTPTLRWRVESETAGLQSIRLTYRVAPLSWSAFYDVVLDETGEQAYFVGRIAIANEAGGRFEEALLELVSTERGALQSARRSALARPQREPQPTAPALRYAYGGTDPVFLEAATPLAPIQKYTLDRPVTLRDGETTYARYVSVESMPVNRFYVYDGVKFDRFPRHRRNDWNYGTEFHTAVETHLQFENVPAHGLGAPLPPGAFRLYQRRADGAVEFLGEDQLQAVDSGGIGSVLLGAARGLMGERERTGYTEVTPLRVYEESFQIRLENNTDEAVEVRVVEHLYRWSEFEIVRADAEYEQTADQTIEFRPVLRPGGRRSIHYTVRYSW